MLGHSHASELVYQLKSTLDGDISDISSLTRNTCNRQNPFSKSSSFNSPASTNLPSHLRFESFILDNVRRDMEKHQDVFDAH